MNVTTAHNPHAPRTKTTTMSLEDTKDVADHASVFFAALDALEDVDAGRIVRVVLSVTVLE